MITLNRMYYRRMYHFRETEHDKVLNSISIQKIDVGINVYETWTTENKEWNGEFKSKYSYKG